MAYLGEATGNGSAFSEDIATRGRGRDHTNQIPKKWEGGKELESEGVEKPRSKHYKKCNEQP